MFDVVSTYIVFFVLKFLVAPRDDIRWTSMPVDGPIKPPIVEVEGSFIDEIRSLVDDGPAVGQHENISAS